MSDNGFEEFARDVIDNLLPKLTDSEMTISLVPTGETDIKFAVELGHGAQLRWIVVPAGDDEP